MFSQTVTSEEIQIGLFNSIDEEACVSFLVGCTQPVI